MSLASTPTTNASEWVAWRWPPAIVPSSLAVTQLAGDSDLAAVEDVVSRSVDVVTEL